MKKAVGRIHRASSFGSSTGENSLRFASFASPLERMEGKQRQKSNATGLAFTHQN
ncbi:MAG TPA: hypothetical protein VIO38_06440 [Rariglobus sp.]